METDDDIRLLEPGQHGAVEATAFRIHASYPTNRGNGGGPAFGGDESLWRQRCRHELQTWLAQAGCPGYAIHDMLGCYDHHAERGVIIERIYPEPRDACPAGFREVAMLIRECWQQEQVWITRTEIELEVIA